MIEGSSEVRDTSFEPRIRETKVSEVKDAPAFPRLDVPAAEGAPAGMPVPIPEPNWIQRNLENIEHIGRVIRTRIIEGK